ncbi:SPX-domain-containing protein, partial [Aureobasidium melanogenum]
MQGIFAPADKVEPFSTNMDGRVVLSCGDSCVVESLAHKVETDDDPLAIWSVAEIVPNKGKATGLANASRHGYTVYRKYEQQNALYTQLHLSLSSTLAVDTLLGETTLEIALEATLAPVCESVCECDGHSSEQKNAQHARAPLVVSHAIADGEQCDDGEGPGGSQSGSVTEVEQGSSDTANDDAELELRWMNEPSLPLEGIAVGLGTGAATANTLCFLEVIILIVTVIQGIVIVVSNGSGGQTLFLVQRVGVSAAVSGAVIHALSGLVLLKSIPSGAQTAVVLIVAVVQVGSIFHLIISVIVHVPAGRNVCALARTFNTETMRDRLADVDIHLRHPEGQQIDTRRVEFCGTVNELGELGHGFHQVRCDKLTNPLRRLLAGLCLQLDLKNSVGEALDIFRRQLTERPIDTNVHTTPVLAGTFASIKVVLASHGQFCIERDTNTGIARQLEGGTVVERAGDGLQLAGDDTILNLSGKLLQVGNLLLALLAITSHLLEGLFNGVVSAHESVDILLLECETSLDGLLASPVFSVGLALDEDGINVHVAIPSQTDGLCTLSLLETAFVQLPGICVVVTSTGKCLRMMSLSSLRNHPCVVVVLEEGLCIEAGSKEGLQLLVRVELIVLLDDLLEASVVELALQSPPRWGPLCSIVHSRLVLGRPLRGR